VGPESNSESSVAELSDGRIVKATFEALSLAHSFASLRIMSL
jgi:hypothetical protein